MQHGFVKLNLLLLIITSLAIPQDKKLSGRFPDGEPLYSYLNLGSISTVFKNTGISDIDIYENNSGFVFPRGSGKTAVFISGLIWGAKITDDPQVRVGGSTYMEGLQGGRILSDGLIEDPAASHVRIYRVRPDVYPGGPNVDLSIEAADEGKSESEIRGQYESDWVEWRAIDGAPFYDGDNDGIYNPDPSSDDIPGIEGASQTIWFVANDQDASKTMDLYGTLPLGIEYQATIWAYAQTGTLENTIFRKYKLINKTDVLGDPKTFEDMYISMWSDPDVGTSTNDFVGCDTLLNLGFAYNAVSTDPIYEPLPPPAVGFDLIRGPLLDGLSGEDKNRNGIEDNDDFGLTENNERASGFINLPMTAFYYFALGDPNISDPPIGTPAGASQFYNFMQGRFGLTGEFFINPGTNLPTTFALSGDPLTGSGWVDGMFLGPGDRRLGLASGPFQMAPGDIQEIVIAELATGAIPGIDRLSAISLLKYYDQNIQAFYDEQFPVSVEQKGNKLIPDSFELYQNYPNPFNPTTIIRYAIPNTADVSIKVFDILGNELAALVNEEKTAGEYEVEFINKGLTSGVYFYQLNAGSVVQTRKMTLIK
jgi:hypothetical protein